MAVRRTPLILLLAACSVLAVKHGLAWRDTIAERQAQLVSTRAEWARTTQMARLVQQRLAGAPRTHPQSVDTALARTMVRMRALALQHLIKLGIVNVTGFHGRNGAAPVTSVSTATASGLAFVPVKVEGTYVDLEGLLLFMSDLAREGVSLRAAHLAHDKFTLELEVYGV